MIEGDDSGDDIWLWVDGDEKWIQEHLKISSFLTYRISPRDLADAQSALRRRMERVQRIPNPPVANLSLQEQSRNARIRNADPGQRLTAISWLIRTSQRKEDVDSSLGWTSQSSLGLFNLIYVWHLDTSKISDSIPLFHEHPDAWEKFKDHREAMGVGVWIYEGPEVESFGAGGCESCESKTGELYDKLYGANHSPNTSAVSLLQAFLLLTIHKEYFFDLPEAPTFPRAVLSRSLSEATRLRMEAQLRAYYPPGARDTQFLPWINAYPHMLRYHLTYLLCRPDPSFSLAPLPSAPTSSECVDASSAFLPAGFADDATEPIIYIGAFAWILACRYISTPSGHNWHDYWLDLADEIVDDSLTDGVLFELAGTSAHLRTHLKHASSLPDATCFRPHTVIDERFWTFYAAVMIISGAVSQSSSHLDSSGVSVAPESDVLRETTPHLAEDNILGPQILQLSEPDHAASLDFSSALDNPALSPREKQARLDILMEKLATQAAAAGLHLRLPPRNTPGASTPSRSPAFTPFSSSSIVALEDSQLVLPSSEHYVVVALRLQVPEKSEPGHNEACLGASTQVTQAATDDTYNASELVKPAKIEAIKAKLLEMLQDINFPVRHGRLPWSTLQADLEDHGYSIVNWPAEVARKGWNKGINSLNGPEVDTLYHAVMHPDEAQSVRFCPRASGSADDNQGSAPSQAVGRLKRPSRRDGQGSTRKRTKFKITTAADFT
ncbi:hypothetical protein BU15DRAFT_79457 [Melanogaster broomeanus]|nr:hypothetical protein BU15DRAFT_79457 [Melanogaster broomeanus]